MLLLLAMCHRALTIAQRQHHTGRHPGAATHLSRPSNPMAPVILIAQLVCEEFDGWAISNGLGVVKHAITSDLRDFSKVGGFAAAQSHMMATESNAASRLLLRPR